MTSQPRPASPPSTLASLDRPIRPQDLQEAKARQERWPMLTCYDALTAAVFDAHRVPVLLVGDSAAMVVHGLASTVAITVADLLPLTAAVRRATRRCLVVADLPFGSYEASPQQALGSAVRFLKEAGANAVKLEGGRDVTEHVRALVSAGVPVMGHIGLRPQSVNALGGYRVQGRGAGADGVLADAEALQAAGAFAIVVEAVPADLGRQVAHVVDIPVVGIGAGPGTDAQVLVWQDLLGLTEDPAPRFVPRYAELRTTIGEAVDRWSQDVRTGEYPGPEHSYS